MKTKTVLALVGLATAATVICLRLPPARHQPPETTQTDSAGQGETPFPPGAEAEPQARSRPAGLRPTGAVQPPAQHPPAPLNKADRLARIRETFHALALGDPRYALQAARQLEDETERETALLALVTEWRHGELNSPRQRAWAIANFGVEAGLGLELAKTPELAMLWANELIEGPGRATVLGPAAVELLDTDPAAAFRLGGSLAASDRRQFSDAVFAGWAQKDTDAALRWAEQLPDAAERDAAVNAIRTVAPVGIGAELRMQDGYPVVNRLLSGMPAELSGQLRPGDRIIAVAQGDNAFVQANGLSLPDVVQAVRGAPGTVLQLQVLPADAPPGSSPRTVSMVRGQIKFKSQPVR